MKENQHIIVPTVWSKKTPKKWETGADYGNNNQINVVYLAGGGEGAVLWI